MNKIHTEVCGIVWIMAEDNIFSFAFSFCISFGNSMQFSKDQSEDVNNSNCPTVATGGTWWHSAYRSSSERLRAELSLK